MPDNDWHTGEYLLWLDNTEGSHFGAHDLVKRHGYRLSDADLGSLVLDTYPPREFSESINPHLVDAEEVGAHLREDHADLYPDETDDDEERCYSDHNEDIRTKGSCDYCGSDKED